MLGNYSQELLKFARSVDIVNEDIWQEVMDGSFTRFLASTKVIRSAGYLKRQYGELGGEAPNWYLYSDWYAKGEGFRGDKFSQYLHDLEKGHTVFSLVKQIKIWVVSKSKKPLNHDTDYEDLLGNATEIPPFRVHPEGQLPYTYTSICFPSTRGVLNLELKLYIRPDFNGWKEMVEQIAESIHLLDALRVNREYSKRNTNKLIRELNDLAAKETTHSYFISYAHEDDLAADQVELFLHREKRDVKRDEDFISGGATIDNRIQRVIDLSDTFIGLWSKDYEQSTSCLAELDYAVDRNENSSRPYRIILLRLDDKEPEKIKLRNKLHLPGQDRPKRLSSIKRITDIKEEERK